MLSRIPAWRMRVVKAVLVNSTPKLRAFIEKRRQAIAEGIRASKAAKPAPAG